MPKQMQTERYSSFRQQGKIIYNLLTYEEHLPYRAIPAKYVALSKKIIELILDTMFIYLCLL